MLNIQKNRSEKKWTLQENVCRLLWGIAYPLFRLSPRPLWGWRRGLLRTFGALIGDEAHIHPTVKISMPWNLKVGSHAAIGEGVIVYNLGFIEIGPEATVSQRVHLCGGSHDYTLSHMPLIKSQIFVGRGAWLCAEAFVRPGISIGDYAIVGARSVVTKDVAEWKVVAGNPAVVVKQRPRPVEK